MSGEIVRQRSPFKSPPLVFFCEVCGWTRSCWDMTEAKAVRGAHMMEHTRDDIALGWFFDRDSV